MQLLVPWCPFQKGKWPDPFSWGWDRLRPQVMVGSGNAHGVRLSFGSGINLLTGKHRTPPHAERVERCLRAGPPRGDKQVRPPIQAEHTPSPPCLCCWSVHTPAYWCHCHTPAYWCHWASQLCERLAAVHFATIEQNRMFVSDVKTQTENEQQIQTLQVGCSNM